LARKAKVKSRGKQAGKRPTGLTAKDYVFPGEQASYWTAVIGTMVVFWGLAAGVMWNLKAEHVKNMNHIPIEIFVYPILAFIVANILATNPRKEALKKAGMQGRVMPGNHPALYAVIERQASLLGLRKSPLMFIVDDKMPLIFTMPGGRCSIIASQALMDALSDDEFYALVAHEMTHIKCRHVRLELAMVFITAAPLGLQIAFCPVWLFKIMSGGWMHLIDFTADRGAYLVMLRAATVNAALVKFAVAVDPNAGISRDELQAFLDSSGDIHTDAVQLERHFKVGQYISNHPLLKERIEELKDYLGTEQGRTALQKMAAVQGVTLEGLAPAPKAARAGDDIEQIDDGDDIQNIPEG
jgi:Zn-dependent protease with chaperone function